MEASVKVIPFNGTHLSFDYRLPITKPKTKKIFIHVDVSELLGTNFRKIAASDFFIFREKS